VEYVELDVLTAVVVNRRFGGTYRLHLQGRISWPATCFHAGILLGLFDPEDGRDVFLRNVGRLSTNYTALYPRRQYFSTVEYSSRCRCLTLYSKTVGLVSNEMEAVVT
jgi:hypothetical protein